MIYIYESHLGGLYFTNEELDYEYLYCETCGDSDWLIATIPDNYTERDIYDLAFELMDDYYTRDDIREFILDAFDIDIINGPECLTGHVCGVYELYPKLFGCRMKEVD